ncbi:MAG TPA: metallophosphoesterase family protein [Dehalococcoidia bacterium]|nr:metallophosphoesterase family protein [Dehalococcoidia bacterium]
MKLGIVSDIHCNALGLSRAIELMGDVDEILCAGDSIYEFRFSDDVVDLIRQHRVRMVLGNHEAVALGTQGRRVVEKPEVKQDNVAWLRDQPWQLETRVNGKRLLMAHGSPFEPWNEYIFPHTPSFKRLAELETDYVILGHTHQAMAERSGRVLVINPGSTGEARDPRIGFQLSFAVLDTQTDEVHIELFPDPQREARERAANGYA